MSSLQISVLTLAVGVAFAAGPAFGIDPPPAESQRGHVAADPGFRTRFSGSVDRIRVGLERRLMALDLSEPGARHRFETGQRLLRAWDDMAALLPRISDENVEHMRGALAEVGRLKALQSRSRAQIGFSMRGPSALGSCPGYPGGSFAGEIGDLVGDMIDLIAGVFSDRDEGETVPGGIQQPSDFISYPAGKPGEQLCKETQSVLEYLTDLMPDLSLSTGVSIFIEFDIGVSVPSPLKIIFATLTESNMRESIEAEFLNAAADDCQRTILQTQISDLQTALAAQLTAFEQKFESRAGLIDGALTMVMTQNEAMRLESCEMIRLLHTPEGQRTSSEPNCADVAGWPFDWNRSR